MESSGSRSGAGSWRWGAVVASAPLLWGAAFPAIKVALDGYTPLQVAAFRILCAALIMLVVAAVVRIPWPPRQDLVRIALVGIIGFPVYQTLTNLGLQTVPAGTGSLLSAVVPLVATAVAFLQTGERTPLRALLGFPVAALGVALIVTGGNSVALRAGTGWLLAAVFSAGVYFALEKELLARHPPLHVLTYTILAGSVATLPLAAGLPAATMSASLAATGASVFLAVFSTIIAFGAMAWGLSKAGTGQTTSYIYLIPVSGLITAWFLLGEKPTTFDVVGGALAFVGVGLVQRFARPRDHASGALAEDATTPVTPVSVNPSVRPLRPTIVTICPPGGPCTVEHRLRADPRIAPTPAPATTSSPVS